MTDAVVPPASEVNRDAGPRVQHMARLALPRLACLVQAVPPGSQLLRRPTPAFPPALLGSPSLLTVTARSVCISLSIPRGPSVVRTCGREQDRQGVEDHGQHTDHTGRRLWAATDGWATCAPRVNRAATDGQNERSCHSRLRWSGADGWSVGTQRAACPTARS